MHTNARRDFLCPKNTDSYVPVRWPVWPTACSAQAVVCFSFPCSPAGADCPSAAPFATSVAVIFPLSILSVIVYYLNGALPVTDALPYLVGGAAGGLIAGRIFKNVRMVWLRRAFGALILYGGIRAVLLL